MINVTQQQILDWLKAVAMRIVRLVVLISSILVLKNTSTIDITQHLQYKK